MRFSDEMTGAFHTERHREDAARDVRLDPEDTK